MPESRRCRITSAPGEPPGSRVMIVRSFEASRRSANFLIWVDFPEPSPPSKEMKRPRPAVRLIAASPISEPRGAGAEHADDELLGAVDRPPHGRSHGNGLGGIDRCFHRHIGPAPDPDHADPLAGGHRRLYRAVIDDARDQL